MIDVVITSDIRIHCDGLSEILANSADVSVVGIVNSCDGAIETISNKSPDVVLLDMTMTGSCDLASQLSQVSPHIKVVALAVSYDEGNIVQCAEAGVTCYVPRESSVNDLIVAMRAAAKGECYCPTKIAACIINELQSHSNLAKNKHMPSRSPRKMQGRVNKRQTCLTQREQQIVRKLAMGLSNKQIARDLSIEVSTVKNHVHNVLVKLEVKNRSQAVFYLQDRSLFPGSESLDLDPV